MAITFYDGSENPDNPKFFIVLRKDDYSGYYVYQKDYVHNPMGKWSLVTSDFKDEVALYSEFDTSYMDKEHAESRAHQYFSFFAQVEADMIDYIKTKPYNIPQLPSQCHECSDMMRDMLADSYVWQVTHPDYDEGFNFTFFLADWKDCFGDDLIPPRNLDKGDDGISK